MAGAVQCKLKLEFDRRGETDRVSVEEERRATRGREGGGECGDQGRLEKKKFTQRYLHNDKHTAKNRISSKTINITSTLPSQQQLHCVEQDLICNNKYYLNITFTTTTTPPRTGCHLKKKISSTLPSQRQLHSLKQDLI